MPAEHEDRARSVVYGGDWVPPQAVPAATVVLLRDSDDGLLVTLMRKELGFARGMYVFPGGALDEQDAALGDPWEVAAIRETFEECGVMLSDPPVTDEATQLRGLDFTSALDRLAARPATADLHPFAHWVTPEVVSRRFDTRFFAAALPAGQELGAVSVEHSDIGWFTPQAASELPMLPPTAAVLAELAGYDDVGQALAQRRTPIPLMPAPVADGDDGIRWVLVDARTGEPAT